MTSRSVPTSSSRPAEQQNGKDRWQPQVRVDGDVDGGLPRASPARSWIAVSVSASGSEWVCIAAIGVRPDSMIRIASA